MKRFITILMIVLSFAVLAGCSEAEQVPESIATDATSNTEVASEASSEVSESTEPQPTSSEPVDVRALALKGATAMGMVEFMNSAESGNLTDNNYSFQIITDTSEIAPMLVKEEIDIAAVPANLASVLYNNTDGDVQVIAINTLGVLYIVENGNSITSLDDLRGKTIYATGNNAVPEYTLRYILSAGGINPDSDVTIEWKSEPAEVLSSIAATPGAIAMLPEPFVTTAMNSTEGFNVVLDLTDEWNKLQDGEEIPSTSITGVVIARTAFIEENPEAVEAFLSHYENSVNFVNENVEEGAKLIGQYEIVSEEVALTAIPKCNISFIAGSEMYDLLSGYLNVLFEQNPTSIGETLPGDDFYYGK